MSQGWDKTTPYRRGSTLAPSDTQHQALLSKSGGARHMREWKETRWWMSGLS